MGADVYAPEWDVSVVVPTIPPRWRDVLVVEGTRWKISYLHRALQSIAVQRKPAKAIVVEADLRHEGAWFTRNVGLAKVVTEWTAFVDDDDQLWPSHLLGLALWAQRTGADYVFSWYEPFGFARDPFPASHFGTPFDPEHPRHTTMTIMVRTELAQSVGFTPRPEGDDAGGEDWRFLLGCLDKGAHVSHYPRRTWGWFAHADPDDPTKLANTSGRGDRWV